MHDTLLILLPHTILAGLACLLILGGAFPIPSKWFGALALAALGIAAGGLWYAAGAELSGATSLAVQRTPLSLAFQWLALAGGALFVLLAIVPQASAKTAGEFYGLLLLIIAGTMLVSSANDLVLLFLSLELISVPTYVLLYLGRHDNRSQEAALKYFLLSVLSAAVLLYGFAFLYGLTGTTRLDGIARVLHQAYAPEGPGLPAAGGSALAVVALVLIFAGLGFKMTAVPFHFYAPDVYEGTSAFNAGLLAVAPKAAALVALILVTLPQLPIGAPFANQAIGIEVSGQQLVLILAGITMTGGNCLALLQSNVRRMLAYSSIAHAGYMLIGIAVGFWESWNPGLSLDAASAGGIPGLPGGVRASLLYLLAYCLTTAGLFGVLVYLGRPGKQIDHVDDLTGLAKTHPLPAAAAALFLFSLAGIPPLPGFWAKLSVFATALSVRQSTAEFFSIHPAFAVLAVVGVVNAAIGAVYYLRLVAVMYLNDPLSAPRPAGGKPALVAVLGAAVLAVLFGLAPRPVFEYLEQRGLRAPVVQTSPRADATASLP